MQGFEDIIIQLLLRHNCVVVPGFGGFVAKQVAAEIDLDKGLISPPKKALLFNRFLLTDDGLLLAEYARLRGLYYDEAKSQLQQHTDALQRQLLNGETIKLPKLGTFSRQADGQINFEQDRFFNLLLSSYGLGNLSFVAQTAPVKEETPIIELHTDPTIRKVNWTRVAAAACCCRSPSILSGSQPKQTHSNRVCLAPQISTLYTNKTRLLIKNLN